jgi:origin recognition complex subunit 1
LDIAASETYKSDETDVTDEEVVSTPKKKRKRPISSTVTPTKRYKVKAPLEITPLSVRTIENTASHRSHTSTPHSIARNSLHVSAVVDSLPCREKQVAEIEDQLESAIEEGSGLCLYISGTPGAGKTASIRQVIQSLQAKVAREELIDFLFVEINGMRVTDPTQAYVMLYQTITDGVRVSPNVALRNLDEIFESGSNIGLPM